MSLDLSPEHLDCVRAILRAHVPELEVRAFGSRVRGRARRTSDLDLALMTDRPIGWECLADLRDAFTESDLPFKVDLVDWATTGDGFRRIIEAESTVLQPARPAPDRG